MRHVTPIRQLESRRLSVSFDWSSARLVLPMKNRSETSTNYAAFGNAKSTKRRAQSTSVILLDVKALTAVGQVWPAVDDVVR